MKRSLVKLRYTVNDRWPICMRQIERTSQFKRATTSAGERAASDRAHARRADLVPDHGRARRINQPLEPRHRDPALTRGLEGSPGYHVKPDLVR